tara:strand:+ start:381 stop:809 length:429 start_codon:yes stop_codon:yes gene_type:complete
MASTLKINTLTGVSTADVINVTTGSTTTTLQLGIASHALHFNHQTPAVIKSLNTSSVTDTAVGQYTPIMTTSYSDANYIMTNSNNFDVNAEADAAGGQLHSLNTTGTEVAPATNTYTVRTDGDSSASKDLKYGYTTAHGDLA